MSASTRTLGYLGKPAIGHVLPLLSSLRGYGAGLHDDDGVRNIKSMPDGAQNASSFSPRAG